MDSLRWLFPALTAGAAFLYCADASAAPRFDYVLGIGIEHNDNVNLSEDDPVSSNIVRPSFGFRLREDGAAVQALAEGLIEYRDYRSGNFSNETRATLDAYVNWELLPDRLDFVFIDHLAEQPINSLVANTPINLQRTNVFALGPTLRFRLGPALRGQAELRYIDSYAEKTDEFDSRRTAGAFRLIKDFSPISQLSANLQVDQIRFKHSDVVPDYDRYSAYARYARRLRLLDLGFDLGYTWLDGADPIGSQSKPLFRATANWHPNSSNSLSVRVAHQYSDTSSDMLDGVPMTEGNRAAALPTVIAIGSNAINSDPFLEDRIELAYAWEATTLSFGVAPYFRRINYLDSLSETGVDDLDQSARGIDLSARWLIRPRLTLGGFANAETLKYSQLDRTDRSYSFGASLLHQWAPHWSWRADLAHYKRDSDAAGQSSDQNIVYLSLAYTR